MQTKLLAAGLILFLILSTVFMVLYFIKPSQEKTKIKKDFLTLLKTGDSMNDTQANCLLDKMSANVDAETLAIQFGGICLSDGQNKIPDVCSKYFKNVTDNGTTWSQQCNIPIPSSSSSRSNFARSILKR
jgi:hypothetical protein